MAGRPAENSLVHMGIAFLAMGGWAAFANRAHPMPEPLVAGLVQGALSAAITLVLKRMVEALGRLFFELGGTIRTGEEVQRIQVEGGRAVGVCAQVHHQHTRK